MRLLFVGDISLGEYYLAFGHGPRTTLASKDIFLEIDKVLQGADVVAGNLEAPLTDNAFDENEPERFVLRGEPKQAAYLRSKGFNVLQIANNHALQHGRKGLEDTVRALEDNGITPIGLKDQCMQVMRFDGRSFGFLAASDVPDNTDKNQSSYQRLNDEFIRRVSDGVAEVDHVFVMLHWGLEESTQPMEYQRELAAELVDAGVTGVIGSHPHLFYEVWVDSQAIVAPSLGNFVFDLCWDSRLLKSGILDISLDEAGIRARVWPVEITQDGAVPTITGPAIEVRRSVKLYDLGNSMNRQLLKKLSFFFRNVTRGRVDLKLKFLASKVLRVVSSIGRFGRSD